MSKDGCLPMVVVLTLCLLGVMFAAQVADALVFNDGTEGLRGALLGLIAVGLAGWGVNSWLDR